MKIVAVDNFESAAVADLLVAANITNKDYAEVMTNALNDKFCKDGYAARHYVIRDDDYRLSRGMEDLV